MANNFLQSAQPGSLESQGVSFREANERLAASRGTDSNLAEDVLSFWRGAPTDNTPTQSTGAVTPRPIETPQSSFESQLSDLEGRQKTEEEIRQENLARAQGMIDATDEVFQAEMAKLGRQGQERLQETRSISTGAGLAGSPFQTAQTDRTKQFTNEIVGARQAERSAEIQSILAQAEGNSTKAIQQQLENFRAERGFLTDERDFQIEQQRLQQETQRDNALGILGTIGSRGISASEIPQEEYRKLLEESGLSDFAAQAYIDSSKPQPDRTYQVANGKLIGYSVDPITGKVTTSSEDIPGLENAAEANIQQFGGVPYVISTDAEGNVSGTIMPGFQAKSTGSSSGFGYSSGFNSGTIPTEETEAPTFEDFIGQKQEELGMSIANPEEYREEFAEIVSLNEQKNELAQRNAKISQLSSTARQVVENPTLLNDFTATQKGAIIREISDAGLSTDDIASRKKQKLPASSVAIVGKIKSARSDVEDILSLVESLEGKVGPVAGRINALNPYDTDVVKLNALIRQTVPGLARGVFGEVGVLTNQDIENYTATLANMNVTTDQAKALTQQLLDKIDKTQTNYLGSFEAANFDTSQITGLQNFVADTGGGEQASSDDIDSFLDSI